MTLTPRWFVHANVNTADLAQAERFYTGVLGLRTLARTSPTDPQDGSGFAMPGQMVRWDGCILGDRRAPRGPLVDLLEWKEPATAGSPAASPSQTGLSALQFGVDDVEEALRRLAAAGQPVERLEHRDPAGDRQVVATSDPDGTRLEVSGLDASTPGPVYRGIRINCTDLARSVDFYTAAFGLEADQARTVTVLEGGRPTGRFRAASVYVPGQREQFCAELTRWEEPAPTGLPPTSGNHTGIYRVALVVSDIDAHHRQVEAVLPAARPPVAVTVFDDQPPLLASFYPDPDGAVVELIEPASAAGRD